MSHPLSGTDCPRCGKPIEGYPALSRTDNTTAICTPCDTDEAIEDAYGTDGVKPREKWVNP